MLRLKNKMKENKYKEVIVQLLKTSQGIKHKAFNTYQKVIFFMLV